MSKDNVTGCVKTGCALWMLLSLLCLIGFLLFANNSFDAVKKVRLAYLRDVLINQKMDQRAEAAIPEFDKIKSVNGREKLYKSLSRNSYISNIEINTSSASAGIDIVKLTAEVCLKSIGETPRKLEILFIVKQRAVHAMTGATILAVSGVNFYSKDTMYLSLNNTKSIFDFLVFICAKDRGETFCKDFLAAYGRAPTGEDPTKDIVAKLNQPDQSMDFTEQKLAEYRKLLEELYVAETIKLERDMLEKEQEYSDRLEKTRKEAVVKVIQAYKSKGFKEGQLFRINFDDMVKNVPHIYPSDSNARPYIAYDVDRETLSIGLDGEFLKELLKVNIEWKESFVDIDFGGTIKPFSPNTRSRFQRGKCEYFLSFSRDEAKKLNERFKTKKLEGGAFAGPYTYEYRYIAKNSCILQIVITDSGYIRWDVLRIILQPCD